MTTEPDASSAELERLKEAYFKEPESSEALVGLITELSKDNSTRLEARELCFKFLTLKPKDILVRLWLARLFYLDKYGEFCVREIVELKRYSKASSLDKLLDAFGAFAAPFIKVDSLVEAAAGTTASESSNKQQQEAKPSVEEDIVAEFDFDADFASVIEDVSN